MNKKDDMLNYSCELKIPHERIAVLIGEKGKIKKAIEKGLGVKLKIDSKVGDVLILGRDSLNLAAAENIVKAIARGFNPEVAFLLMGEDSVFETISISDYTGKSKKKLIRVRGRVIGAEGKARALIEELSGAHVVVYGKTIGIIGSYVNVDLARKAFESLLAGARHATVYAWLEKHARELRQAKRIEV